MRVANSHYSCILKSMKMKFFLPLICVPLLFIGVSCEKKGPAEKVGEAIDDAVKEVGDAVTPQKSPGEKIGEAIDNATGN